MYIHIQIDIRCTMYMCMHTYNVQCTCTQPCTCTQYYISISGWQMQHSDQDHVLRSYMSMYIDWVHVYTYMYMYIRVRVHMVASASSFTRFLYMYCTCTCTVCQTNHNVQLTAYSCICICWMESLMLFPPFLQK